jgi:hypothetical protein
MCCQVLDGGRIRLWDGPARASKFISFRVRNDADVKWFACRADYMQGTRVPFNTKEDAIRFAEKQGDYSVFMHEVMINRVRYRLGLLRPASCNQADSAKELQRELPL